MPVYVDDLNKKYGRMYLSHMLADTTIELDVMVARLRALGYGGKIQYVGTAHEHYDINLHYKAMAMRMGAIHVRRQISVAMVRKKIESGLPPRERKKSLSSRIVQPLTK